MTVWCFLFEPKVSIVRPALFKCRNSPISQKSGRVTKKSHIKLIGRKESLMKALSLGMKKPANVIY